MPPLRERREDIPTLVEYFIHRYSRKAGKKMGTIEKRTLELLESYAWPGNIRELQNVIERSVIVCETDLFSVDPSWLSLESSSPREGEAAVRKEVRGSREGSHRGGIGGDWRPCLGTFGSGGPTRDASLHSGIQDPVAEDQ